MFSNNQLLNEVSDGICGFIELHNRETKTPAYRGIRKFIAGTSIASGFHIETIDQAETVFELHIAPASLTERLVTVQSGKTQIAQRLSLYKSNKELIYGMAGRVKKVVNNHFAFRLIQSVSGIQKPKMMENGWSKGMLQIGLKESELVPVQLKIVHMRHNSVDTEYVLTVGNIEHTKRIQSQELQTEYIQKQVTILRNKLVHGPNEQAMFTFLEQYINENIPTLKVVRPTDDKEGLSLTIMLNNRPYKGVNNPLYALKVVNGEFTISYEPMKDMPFHAGNLQNLAKLEALLEKETPSTMMERLTKFKAENLVENKEQEFSSEISLA